eukprot:4555057-Pyramimonas_sp.AAC.1
MGWWRSRAWLHASRLARATRSTHSASNVQRASRLGDGARYRPAPGMLLHGAEKELPSWRVSCCDCAASESS